MAEVALIQPRHIYAPAPSKARIGHVYMPTSLLTVAARLLRAGVVVSFFDENLGRAPLDSCTVGINLVGAPYVSRAREFVSRLRRRRSKAVLLLGGRVVSGFRPHEMLGLFGPGAVNGNDDQRLAEAVGCDYRLLPAPERTALAEAYELIQDVEMRCYLRAEFGFFLSRGCRFRCTFCAAERTARDTVTGRLRRVTERYRELEFLAGDLTYLIKRARRLGLDRLRLYLSNLDLFQTPTELGEFARLVAGTLRSHRGFVIDMRGLSTVHSFLRAHRFWPDVIAACVDAGIRRVGFGVDGATAEVFRGTRKPQTATMCEKAIEVARSVYGITPETLMVFGHTSLDTEDSLRRARDFTRAMWEQYGALPRPHVAKSVVPGNDGWYEPAWSGVVQTLLAQPSLFQALDFTALPSPLTHPDKRFCALVARYYREVCELQGAVTLHILPELPGMTAEELRHVRAFNEGRYDI